MVNIFDMILYETRSEQRTVRSEIRRMLLHMLKCKYQNDYPDKKSWRRSILGSYYNLLDAFKGQIGKGSLYKRFYLKGLPLDKVYQEAVDIAVQETKLDKSKFPETCEWDKSQLVDKKFIDDFIKTYGKDSGDEN